MIWTLFMACAPSANIFELAPTGLKYSLNTVGSEESTDYRIVGDGEAVPATGVIESGVTCLIASSIEGTETKTASYERQDLLQVVGHTPLNHPLVPDDEDVFSEREAMILQERNRIAKAVVTQKTTYDPDSALTYESTEYEDTEQESGASYFGVTGDEYVVRFELAALWSDFEELDPGRLTLLTKNEPSIGDVWVSANGNILYIYAGKDVVNIGAIATEVDKVNLYEVTGLQPAGKEVMDDCINIGVEQLQSNDPSDSQANSTRISLDSGCLDNFTHKKTGTQWWYKNLLIKEEATVQIVTIENVDDEDVSDGGDVVDGGEDGIGDDTATVHPPYGYEWYVDDGLGTCTRQTSDENNDPSLNAQIYVEYKLSTISYVTELVDWIEPL